jgi:hypothetical protein
MWHTIHREKCCFCFPIRVGVIIIAILVMIQAIFNTLYFPYWGYWLSMVGDLIFASYGLIGAINYSYAGVRMFFWWLLFDLIWNVAMFIVLLFIWDDVCNNLNQTNNDFQDAKECKSDRVYGGLVLGGIIAITIRLWFVIVVWQFSVLLEELWLSYFENPAEQSWFVLYRAPLRGPQRTVQRSATNPAPEGNHEINTGRPSPMA